VAAVVALSSGCGSAPSAGGDDAPAPAPETGAPAPATDEQVPTDSTPTKPAAADDNVEHHSMLVADVAALPACDASAEGWLVYVKKDAQFKVCATSAWADVDIKGEKGDAGKDGTDNHVAGWIYCSGQLENTTLFYVYQASITSAGDVFAYGGIRSASLQIGAPAFYAAAQNGAQTAAVNFTDDFETAPEAAFWDMSTNRQTLVVTMNYHTSGGITTWTQDPSECVVH
jgi:hypothetical protein